MKYSIAALLCLIPALPVKAADETFCTLSVLADIGWQLEAESNDIGFENTDSCNTNTPSVFKYNRASEGEKLLTRSQQTLRTLTSKCLFNRSYHESVKTAVGSLSNNRKFEFLPVGDDPRDPFKPPAGTWNTTGKKGYDTPLENLSSSIQPLYNKPFVAECSAAVQVAQLAALSEHFADQVDEMISTKEVGIGTWRQFAKTPSIAAKQSLFISDRDRGTDPLAKLAATGRASFYGQVGYLKPYKGKQFIDSWDNLGQNYMIVNITDKAIAALRARDKPTKELSRVSRKVWKKYRKRRSAGEEMDKLKEEMQTELEQADPFFSEVEIYVHPLRTKNFAEHIARQFSYNSRTPYVIEVYEDYQTGYFFNRFIEYRLGQCRQQ